MQAEALPVPNPAHTASEPIATAISLSAAPLASDSLPVLTPVLSTQQDAPAVSQQQHPLLAPQPSPKIKPPPASQSSGQSALPLWQMFRSGSNTPAAVAFIAAGNQILNLDDLAKAAVKKRKEQVCRARACCWWACTHLGQGRSVFIAFMV